MQTGLIPESQASLAALDVWTPHKPSITSLGTGSGIISRHVVSNYRAEAIDKILELQDFDRITIMADSSALTTTTSLTKTVVSATLSSVRPHYTREKGQEAGSGWSSPSSFPTKLLSGNPSTIALAFLVALALPILLHLYFYSQSARSRGSGGSSDGVPSFLLLGPSNSGKTSLVTVLQRRMIALSTPPREEAENEKRAPQVTVNGNGHTISASPTRLSQAATTVGLYLPPGTPLGSNKYRSENDFEVANAAKTATPYKLIDTPGHGKLRLEQALNFITRPGTGLRGVIFMLDSAAIESSDSPVSKDTAQYLHDVLLVLQKRPKLVKKAKAEDVKVLIAANKQDLFTALPANAIRRRLQDEIERVRSSKRRGVTAVDAKDDDVEDEDATLGGGGEGVFTFEMLEEEFGIVVDVVGGAVKGDEDGTGVRKWEEWLGSCL